MSGARSYYVKVRATVGTCLGGVKSYDSSRFETYEQAEDFRDEALRANLEAGRDVVTHVRNSRLAPEIFASETGHASAAGRDGGR